MVENPSTGGVVNLRTKLSEPVFELRTVLGVGVAVQSRKTDTTRFELDVVYVTTGRYYLTVRDSNNKTVVKRLHQ